PQDRSRDAAPGRVLAVEQEGMTPEELLGNLTGLFPDFAAHWQAADNVSREEDGSFTLCGAFSAVSDFFRERYAELPAEGLEALLSGARRGAGGRPAASARLDPGRVHGRARLRSVRGDRHALPRERGGRALPRRLRAVPDRAPAGVLLAVGRDLLTVDRVFFG